MSVPIYEGKEGYWDVKALIPNGSHGHLFEKRGPGQTITKKHLVGSKGQLGYLNL